MPNTESTNQVCLIKFVVMLILCINGPSFFVLSKNLKTVFLPEGANQWLTERFKLGGGKDKERKEKKEKASVPAKRKAPATKTNGHAK